MSVFLLKTHLHPIGLMPSGASTSVQTRLAYMESISDFMASSQFPESISNIAFSYVVGSSSSLRFTLTCGEMRYPYLSGSRRILPDLHTSCVTGCGLTISSCD